MSSNDFSDDANYEELARRVISRINMAYMAVNMCLLNFDWPNNNCMPHDECPTKVDFPAWTRNGAWLSSPDLEMRITG